MVATATAVGVAHIPATAVAVAYIATAATVTAGVCATYTTATTVGATHIPAKVAGNHGDAQGQGAIVVGDRLHPLGFYATVTAGVAASICHKIGEPKFISAHSLRLQSKMS